MAVNSVIKELGNYKLEIFNIIDFKSYYNENLGRFNSSSEASFLKTVDIPAKFFKEQPLETQEELIENRDVFVRENKKYFDKVIVVLIDPSSNEILNACRMSNQDSKENYDKLKPIDSIEGKFEHRTFMKDGYASIIISETLKKDVENKVLVVDFPLLMNKKVVVHKALFKLASENSAVPIDHIRYLTSDELDLKSTYTDIEDALKDFTPFLKDDIIEAEEKVIYEEAQVISLALVADEIIPKSYVDKIAKYVDNNIEDGGLTTKKLESLVLDFDRDVKTYKQVTNLRKVSGHQVISTLESDDFQEVKEALGEIE